MKRNILFIFKLLFILAILFGGIFDGYGATRYSVATGNWNATGTWSATSGGASGASVPLAGDIVYIERGYTVTVNITNAGCANIYLGRDASGGGTTQTGFLTFATTGSPVLTVSGAVQIGGSNSTTSSGTITFVSGSSLVAGSLILGNGTNNAPGSLTMTNNSTLTINGAITVAGTGTKTWTPSTGTVILAGNNTLPTTVFTNFNNLTCSAGTTTMAATLTINGDLNIGDGATFSIGAYSLTVTGVTNVGNGTSGNLTITSTTGTETFTGLVTIANGATWNNSINEAITLKGGITNNGTFTSGTGVYTFNTYNQALNGTISIPSITVTGVTLTNNGTLTVGTALSGTGGLTQSTTGMLNIGGTSGISTLTATAVGNTVNYTGTSQTLKVTAYHHLTLSGGAETFGAITTIAGNLILSGTATATTAAALTIGGNFNVGFGTTFTTGATNSWTLGVTGTTMVSGTLTLANAGTKTFSGDVTVNTGGVWNETGIAAVNYAGNLQNDGTTFAASAGTHTFSGTNKAISGGTAISIPTATFTGNYVNSASLTVGTALSVTSPAVLTNNSTITATTALSGTGSLTQGTGSTLNIGGTSGITGLDASTNANTVNFTGVAQTCKVTTYYNLTLSGSGAKTFATTPTVNAVLSLEGTASVVVTTGVVTYGTNATLQYNKSAAYTATAEEWITPFTATGGVIVANTGIITTFAALTLSAGVPLTINSGSTLATGATSTWTLTVGGATSISGTLTLANTAAKTFTGNVTVNTGGVWNETGVAAINYAGNLQNDGQTFTANSGTHTFSGANKTISGANAISIPTATFTGNYTNNASLLTFTTALSGNGSLTQGSGSTLVIGGTSLITGFDASTSTNTVTYTGANVAVRATTYSNLTLNGTGTATIGGATVVNGTLTINNSVGVTLNSPITTSNLTLTSGILNTTNTNILTVTNTDSNSIQSASATSYINGPLARTLLSNIAADGTTYSFPVGDGANYKPLDLVNIRTGTNTPIIKVNESSSGATTADITTISTISTRNWYVQTISGDFTSGYIRLNDTGIDATKVVGQSASQSGTYSSIGATNPGSSITSGIATTSNAYFAIGSAAPKTFYSYQSGDWSTSSTWTKDPSGSFGIDIGVPNANDNVVILNARTVKITSDSQSCNSLEIRLGGALDLTTTKSHNFTTVTGQGLLRLSSEFFPSGNFASFVASNGGTVEYYDLNNKRISNSQLTYNNLIISNSTTAATAVFLDNATNPINYVLNGNFELETQSSGSLTFYFGNPTASDNLINMSVNGNFAVGAGCNIRVNNFATAHTIPNPALASTLPLPAYPVHTLTLNGDLTNNGTVRFTGLPSPLDNAYYLLTTTASGGVNYGDVQVYFKGSTDNTLTCNGTTDFFRVVLEKGIDQTKILEVNSSSTSNFALYAPNFQGFSSFNGGPEGYGIGAYSKALYIHYGTLKLNANINIPSLAEGGQDFNLIPTAGLWINGATVSTTVSGVNGTSYQAATLYGKLRISSGSFSTGDAAGIVLGVLGTPEIRIEGTGTLDVGQAWVASGSTNLMSYVQTGGTANFRMLGEHQTGPMLGLNNTNTVFTMTGGTLNFSNYLFITNETDYQIMDIQTQQGNYQVTGGTVNLNLPSSTTTYTANSTVPFYNLNITNKTGSGTTSIQWNTPGPNLTILNDLSIGSNSVLNLNTNTVNLVVGHNFNLLSGATYTPGNNTTTFNGTGGQVFTNTGTITTGLHDFVLSNLSNTTISNNLAVLGNLTINNSCFLNDQGFSVSVAGNITNSGTHASQANGSIILNGTVAQTIGGSGSGIFGNLTINKTAGTTTFSANQSVTGNLRLVTGILDINRYNLKLSASSGIYDVLTGTTTPTTFGTTKMITTTGQQSDGGLTRGFNAIGTLLYPFGSGGAYHPATISFSQAPVNWGDITIKPVGLVHPFVNTGNLGAMKYYWKVISNGFSGIQPTSVSHTYQYVLASDVVGTEANYITGIYNPFTWTKGATAQVDKINKKILFPSINLIDGDYTAGTPSAFGAITVYYSRQSGDWGTAATWSKESHTGAASTTLPGAGDVVEIGDGAGINHVVTISANGKVVGGLKLNQGSTLDLQTYTGHNFGALPDMSVSGTGTLRISSAVATAVFPSGDFGSFLGSNGGTVEYYTESGIGTAFTLPTTYITGSTINISNYPNLILSPASGKNITLPNTDLIVFKDLNINTSGTSTAGITQLNNTTNSRTLTIYGNLNVNKGNLQYTNGGSLAQNVVVNGNVTIVSGATFDVAAANSATNTLTINGDLTNNGTFDMIAGAAQICNVTFTGAGNSGIKGTTAVRTDFNILTVNKGTNRNSILEATVNAFTLNTSLAAALTLTNGTFRLSTPLTITLTTTNAFTIPTSGCLSANIGTINIGAANNNAGDLLLQGRLEVMNSGIVNIGNGSGSNNDIEYASAGNPELNVSGGSLNVDGQIRRSTANTLGSLWFTQTGGTITVKGKSFDSTRGMFEILNSGSQFNVSGGNLIIETSGSVNTADIYITPESSVVDNSHGGHTLTIGDTNTPTGKTFKLNSSAALWNLTIDGTTYNKTTILQVYPLSILNNLTINSNGTGGSFFQANELDVTIGGSLINNNRTSTTGIDQGGYQAGAVGSTQTTTFTGVGQITGTTGNLTNFANLTIGTSGTTPAITLGSNSNIRVNKDLKIILGTLADAGNTISVLGNIANFGIHTSPNTPGGGIVLINNIEQKISGSGSGIFGNMTINNAANAHIVDNMVINGQLSLLGGSMYIDDYLLTLGVNATFSDFSASHMIISNGVLSDLGVQKQFSGSVSSFVFPVGTQGNYRPVTYSITSPSGGAVKVISVAQPHPVDDAPTNDQLNYYWKTTVTGFSGLISSTQIYQYGLSDVTGNESNYHGALYRNNGWTDYGTTVINTSTHTLTITRSDLLGGDYTAGEVANFTNKPLLYSTGSGNWSDGTKWSIYPSGSPTYGSGPSGNPVFIQASHVITMDINYASASSVNIEGTLDLVATSHHNIGSITDTLHVGKGTIRIQSTSDGIFLFPEANYDRFMASPGTTVELYGSNDAVIPLKPGNLYKPYQNLVLSGTGIKYLSADNLKVVGNLTINNGTRLNNTLNNSNQYISGNWTDYNTSTSVAGFVPGTGLTTFEGSSSQTLTVTNSGLSEEFYDFKINNPSGLTISGGGNVKVDNLLYLQNGAITTNSINSFTLTNSSTSTVSGGSINSFINGPLRKQIAAGSSFTFPVGKNGTPSRYGNITLTGVADAGIWEAEYFNGDPTANSPSLNRSSTLLPIDQVSSNEYWRVNGISSASTANVTLRWDANSGYAGSSAATRTKIRLVEWNGTQWVYRGKILNDGGDISGTVRTDNSISLSSSANPHWFTIGNEGLPTATITSPLTASICNDGIATTTITVALTGTAPWSLSYRLGSVTTTLSNIASSPVSIVLTSNSPGIVQPISTNTVFNFKITNVNDLVGIAGINDYNTTVAITVKPVPNNTITGRISVGTGELVSYTTPADAITYSWTLSSNGTPLTGNSSTYNVTWGSIAGSNLISLTKVTSGGCSISTSLSVTTSISPTPVITGNQKVCAGLTGNTYSTPLVAGHSYTWTISGNGTITSGATSNSCTVTWNTALSGNTISVIETNSGVSITASIPVDVGMQPSATIPSISFPTAVCNGNTATITVNNSEKDVRYQLRLNSNDSNVGNAVDGNNGIINLTSTALIANTTFYIYAYTLDPFNCGTKLNNPSTFTVIATPLLVATISYAGSPFCKSVATAQSVTRTGTAGGTYTASPAGLTIDGTSGAIIPSTSAVGIYTVTYTMAATGGCSIQTATTTVTINPTPNIASSINTTTCSGSQFTVSPTDGSGNIVPLGTLYSWSAPSVAGITGTASGTDATNISGTLTNTTSSAIDVSYTVTPKSSVILGSCVGTSFTVTIKVYPKPNIASSINTTACSGSQFTVSPTDGSGNIVPSGTLYSWSAPSVAGITGTASGTDATNISGTLTNTTNESINVVYTVTPTSSASLGSCVGANFTVTIRVNPDGSWTGAFDGDWNNPANWACNATPFITTNVIIANGRLNYPTLSSGAIGTTKNLTIENNASLTVTSNTFQIAGAISNAGTFTASAGTIEMKGTAAQTIGANVFAGNTIMNLTINNLAGTTLTGPLNVTGIVLASNGNVNSNGNLTLVSTAIQTALIDGSGNGDVLGNVTMQRYLPSAFGYKYFSSPFQSATVNQFAGFMDLSASFPTFYRYDENHLSLTGTAMSGWTAYTTGTLNPMEGYAVNFGTVASEKTVGITGTVNNRSLSIVLSNNNQTYTKGFNLVGNPYPSPIDWNASGWGKNKIDDAIYFFNSGNTDQYTGFYTSYISGVSTGDANNIIASMQGFFVHVTDGIFPVSTTLDVTNSVRINNLYPTFKNATIDDRAILRFTANFKTKNAIEDATVIYFDKSTTSSYDKERDALKLMNTDLLIPNIYTYSTEITQLSINGMPEPIDSITKIPLGITTFSDGWINFDAKDISRLPSNLHIYLLDNEKNILQDLEHYPEYPFYLKAGEYNQRFLLVFSLSEITNPLVDNEKMFTMTRNANHLFVNVNLPVNSKGKIIVTNMLGQIMLQKEVFGKETVEINANVSSGVYLVTLIEGKRKQAEKILIRKDYE